MTVIVKFLEYILIGYLSGSVLYAYLLLSVQVHLYVHPPQTPKPDLSARPLSVESQSAPRRSKDKILSLPGFPDNI